jgi:protein-S-isoprenylcysteine O-methyltransferase Ste14
MPPRPDAPATGPDGASSRVPSLGPRGEGWVLLQLVLFGVIGVGGLAALASSPPIGAVDVGRVAIGGVAVVVGGIVAVLGVLGLGSSLSPFPKPVDGSELVTHGVYGVVRHPIYSGILLAAMGWTVLTASVVALAGSVLLLLLFDAKSRREEVWLVERHPGYAGYRARTKRLIPRVY